jgi:hypothetical protein
MGLEPTTFCMANTSDRALTLAPVRSNRLPAGLPYVAGRSTAPERSRRASEAGGRTRSRQSPSERRDVCHG